MQNEDIHFLGEAYQTARASAEQGFDPFGAILVKDGEIVARSIDKCIVYADPTAHAERILISEYCQENQLISLENYALYCNVEPCVMCSGAIHWAKISKVVFGLSQTQLQKKSMGRRKPSCRDLINIGGQKVEILGPMLEAEGLAILEAFPFKSKKERHQIYQQLKSRKA